MRTNRFNQDLRAVMDIIISDLRRAGFSAVPEGGTANPFTEAATDMHIYRPNLHPVLVRHHLAQPPHPGFTQRPTSAAFA